MEKLKRPKTVKGCTVRTETGCGNVYITISYYENKPFEVFATLGKSGGCAKCQLEAMTRAITMGLRYGVPAQEYVNQLKDISCPSPGVDVKSCPDAISKVLAENMTPKEEQPLSKEVHHAT